VTRALPALAALAIWLATIGGVLIPPANGGTPLVPPALAQTGGPTDLLPNLRPLPALSPSFDTCDGPDEGTRIPGTRCVRFGTQTANYGSGPLELRVHPGDPISNNKQKVYQRVYRTDGSSYERIAGEFVFHPQHNHFHFEGYATYELQPVGAPGASKRIGSKTSFCILDTVAVTGSAGLRTYMGCNDTFQGMSVGWSDIYDSRLWGQQLDVGGLPSGNYTLRIIIDPQNRLTESSSADNVSETTIFVPDVGGGTPTPTTSSTPTSTATPTATTTPSPTATPTSTPTNALMRDTFSRSLTRGWGSAEVGGQWFLRSIDGTTLTDATGSASVSSGRGSATVSTTGGSRFFTAVSGPASAADYEVVGTLATGPPGSLIGLVGRAGATGSYLVWISTGQTHLRITTGAVTGPLGTGTLSGPVAANTDYTLRFQLQGTSLRARAWQTGTPEPPDWQVTATDAHVAAGRAGVLAGFSNTGTGTFTFDNLVVTPLP
jgi:hypothetical protein